MSPLLFYFLSCPHLFSFLYFSSYHLLSPFPSYNAWHSFLFLSCPFYFHLTPFLSILFHSLFPFLTSFLTSLLHFLLFFSFPFLLIFINLSFPFPTSPSLSLPLISFVLLLSLNSCPPQPFSSPLFSFPHLCSLFFPFLFSHFSIHHFCLLFLFPFHTSFFISSGLKEVASSNKQAELDRQEQKRWIRGG